MSQLAMSMRQIDDTIALARTWCHDLYHATESFDMERTGEKLAAAMKRSTKHATRSKLRGRHRADHNAVGTVRLV